MTDKSMAAVLAALEAGEAPGPAKPDRPGPQAAGGQPRGPKRKRAAELRGRTVARLAAVQALYQMELGAAGVEAVIREFSDHRFSRDPEGEGGAPLLDADEAMFAELVRGVVREQAGVDAAIARRLAEGWRLERLDATVRAILRSAAYELLHRPETPIDVVIGDYLELTKAFFAGTEAAFVNGALDAVAQDVRG